MSFGYLPRSGAISRLLLLRLHARQHTSRASAATVPGSNIPATVDGKPASEVYDDKSDRLQTIDIEDLPRAQKRYAIQFEEINAQRIKEIFAKNYKVSFIYIFFLNETTLHNLESHWSHGATYTRHQHLLLYNTCCKTRDFLRGNRRRSRRGERRIVAVGRHQNLG